MDSNADSPEEGNEYDAALSAFYEPYFTGVEGDVAFYVAQAQAAGSPVLELGCGSGRILIPTAQAGVSITGLDRSAPMLAQARQRVAALAPETRRRIRLIQGDMRDFAIRRRFKLVTIPYRAFQHLLTPADQAQALLCIRDHLTKRGRLVFNLYDPSREFALGRATRAMQRDDDFIHPATGNRVVTWYRRQHEPVEQIMVQEFLFEEVDAGGSVLNRVYKTLTLRYTFRCEMQYLLELCGYTIEALHGDFHGGPYRGAEQVWVAQPA